MLGPPGGHHKHSVRHYCPVFMPLQTSENCMRSYISNTSSTCSPLWLYWYFVCPRRLKWWPCLEALQSTHLRLRYQSKTFKCHNLGMPDHINDASLKDDRALWYVQEDISYRNSLFRCGDIAANASMNYTDRRHAINVHAGPQAHYSFAWPHPSHHTIIGLELPKGTGLQLLLGERPTLLPWRRLGGKKYPCSRGPSRAVVHGYHEKSFDYSPAEWWRLKWSMYVHQRSWKDDIDFQLDVE